MRNVNECPKGIGLVSNIINILKKRKRKRFVYRFLYFMLKRYKNFTNNKV